MEHILITIESTRMPLYIVPFTHPPKATTFLLPASDIIALFCLALDLT